jgi:glycerate kinase
VEHLTARLRTTADLYARELDVDVRELPGSGAAGGLAGGLAALGARLVPGFELVAAHVHLDEELSGADVVVTGEGSVDETSFAGKVVGEVSARAGAAGVPVFVVAGEVRLSRPELQAMSLVDRFGAARAWREPEACISRVVTEMLRARGGSPPPAADTP